MTAMPGGLKKPEQPPDMVLMIHRPVLALTTVTEPPLPPTYRLVTHNRFVLPRADKFPARGPRERLKLFDWPTAGFGSGGASD